MPEKSLNTINDYISTFPADVQKKLREVLAEIQSAAPDAHEETKWSRPAFSDEERILVMFAGFRHHIGFYITPGTLRAFKEDLAGFKTGKGSVQFPHDKPLPLNLIRKMTEYRVFESREKGVNWKA